KMAPPALAIQGQLRTSSAPKRSNNAAAGITATGVIKARPRRCSLPKKFPFIPLPPIFSFGTKEKEPKENPPAHAHRLHAVPGVTGVIIYFNIQLQYS